VAGIEVIGRDVTTLGDFAYGPVLVGGLRLPGNSTSVSWDEFHGHVAQFGINPAPSPQRPPIIKIDLHRSPHRDPARNRKALPHDGSPGARVMPYQYPAEEQTCSQEHQTDDKTRAALLQEPFEFQVSDFGSVRKVVVDGLRDQFFRIFGRPLVQEDTQFDWSVRGEFLGPTHNEFFRVVVEILFDERRRVHRIEELIHVVQFQADAVRVLPVRGGSV
jgi:hypothetical protein